MNSLKKVALLCALLLAAPAFAQTTVSGTRVQDGGGNGNLLISGQWCFATTCVTVTNGAFSGSVTAGTQTVTVKNASSATILTVPGVVIGSSAFSWDSFVVPSTASISGTGTPTIACQVGATYTETDNSDEPWSCANVAGLAKWQVESTNPVLPSGDYSGYGSPNFICTAPCTYNELSRSPYWKTTSQSGGSFNSWIQYIPTSGTGGSPGGTTGSIQYNNDGTFGGAPITGFVYGNGSSPPRAAAPTDLAAFLAGVTGCASPGNAYVPADNECEPVGGGSGGSSAFTTLADGATVTWSLSNSISNAVLTLNHATATRALNLSGLSSGYSGTLVLKQDSTGGAAMTLGTGCTWLIGGNGGGVITLSTAANAVDVLTFVYDGTYCYANFRTAFN